MQMVDTITRSKVFEILWLYVANLLKRKKPYPCQKQKRLKRYGAGISKYEAKMVQAYILVSLQEEYHLSPLGQANAYLDY